MFIEKLALHRTAISGHHPPFPVVWSQIKRNHRSSSEALLDFLGNFVHLIFSKQLPLFNLVSLASVVVAFRVLCLPTRFIDRWFCQPEDDGWQFFSNNQEPPEDGKTLINGQLAVNLSVQINQSAGKTRRFVCGQTARDIRDLYKQEYLKYLWSLCPAKYHFEGN